MNAGTQRLTEHPVSDTEPRATRAFELETRFVPLIRINPRNRAANDRSDAMSR